MPVQAASWLRGQVKCLYLRGFSIKKGPVKITWKTGRDQSSTDVTAVASCTLPVQG